MEWIDVDVLNLPEEEVLAGCYMAGCELGEKLWGKLKRDENCYSGVYCINDEGTVLNNVTHYMVIRDIEDWRIDYSLQQGEG